MPKKADFTEGFTHSIAKTAVLKITKRTARVTKADNIFIFFNRRFRKHSF
jgi:hypothetical protein